MVLGALVEEHRDFFTQLGQPAVALGQFLAEVLVLAEFDEVADGLAQALNEKGNVVLDQLGVADAQLAPVARARDGGRKTGAPGIAGGLPAPGGFVPLVDFVASRFDPGKELVGFLEQVPDQFQRSLLRQHRQQAFLGARVPEPLQVVAHLRVGHAQADVFRGDGFHRVRLVENDEIILEQQAALDVLLQAAEQREEERVIEHQHVRGEDVAAGALIEADGVLFGELRRVAANFRPAQPALRAHLPPDLGVGFHVKIRQAAVGSLLRPLLDPLEFLGFG